MGLSKAQLKQQAINEVAKKYSKQLADVQTHINYWVDKYNSADKLTKQLMRENEQLKEKIQKLEDWNDRLLSYMDMTPEEREQAFIELRAKHEEDETFNKIFSSFSSLFNFTF